jgi:hypothetical protein
MALWSFGDVVRYRRRTRTRPARHDGGQISLHRLVAADDDQRASVVQRVDVTLGRILVESRVDQQPDQVA